LPTEPVFVLERGQIALSGPTVEILPQILSRGGRRQQFVASDSGINSSKETTTSSTTLPSNTGKA